MRYTILTLFLMLTNWGFSQNVASENWTFLKEEQGVKFYYRYADCDLKDEFDQQFLFIKVENTTNTGYYVEWTWDLWLNNKCHTCQADEGGEFRKMVKVEAGKSIEPSCELYPELSELTMFSKFIEIKTDDLLTKFDIKDIILTPLED